MPVQLQIDIGNAIGMRVVILLSRAGAPVGAATVGADNANGCVNGYLCYMDSLWHQLARHTLSEARFAVGGGEVRFASDVLVLVDGEEPAEGERDGEGLYRGVRPDGAHGR